VAAKDRGNAAFKAGDYCKAVELYTEALSLDGSLLAARNNRAMAYLSLGRAAEAEADCDAVLTQEPRNVKALLRRASAREARGDAERAADDLRAVLAAEPGNRQALEQLARAGSRGGAQDGS